MFVGEYEFVSGANGRMFSVFGFVENRCGLSSTSSNIAAAFPSGSIESSDLHAQKPARNLFAQ